MKNALLLPDFCEEFHISEDTKENARRMTDCQLSLLVTELMKRLKDLEETVEYNLELTKQWT